MENVEKRPIATGVSFYEMRKWWITKAKWYHHKNGHFDTDLYLRICEVKKNREQSK
jgi:hypothetical protein